MIAFECEDYSSITALIKKSNLSFEVEKLNAAGKEKKTKFDSFSSREKTTHTLFPFLRT